jgi:hypothetical protein
MLRSAISAFTRVFDALWLAAWCAADPGPIVEQDVGPGSAVHRKGALHRVRDTKYRAAIDPSFHGARRTYRFHFSNSQIIRNHGFAISRRDAPGLCMYLAPN